MTDSWALALAPETGLYTPGTLSGPFVLTTSEPLASRRNVRGVQFATQQTPALQRLLDPDFNDPSLQYWRPYGGAVVESSTDLNTDIGTTVKITRSTSGSYWNYLEVKYAHPPGVPYSTWDAIEDSDPSPTKPTWNDLEDSQNTADDARGGVESTERIDMPLRGRIYAAARIYAPQVLTAPLHIQIVGEVSDGQFEVLSDEQTDATPGQVVEWFTSYTVGEGGDPPTGWNTWDEVEAFGTWNEVQAVGTWNEVSNTAEVDIGFGGFTGNVFPRLVQSGATTDVFYVDNIALYEDPIIWEFSNDSGDTWYPAYGITNNPDGVLLFPDVLTETSDDQTNTSLAWRVSGYRPDLHISTLLIRPWYSSLHLGVAPRTGLEYGGPNQTPYDQYPAIHDSPLFKAWSKPIPEDWWFFYRQWLLQQSDLTTFEVGPTVPSNVYLVEAIVL